MISFHTPGFVARPLRRDEIPTLQALFDASPEYFQIVNGRNAHPDEAAEEFDELPPPDMPFGGRWCLGLYTDKDELIGVAIGLSDFLAPQVWHLGLFWLATPWHGRGAAAALGGLGPKQRRTLDASGGGGGQRPRRSLLAAHGLCRGQAPRGGGHRWALE